MRLSHFFCVLTVLPLAACATVNLAEVSPAAQKAEAPAVENVVVKASKVLVSTFEKRGWSEAAGSNKMQSAARLLLKGLGDKKAESKITYASTVKSPGVLEGDMVDASVHIEDLVKAAEVFLAMSDAKDDLRGELQSLEQALGACHKAEINFKQSAEKFDEPALSDDVQSIQTLVLRLRDITNTYGNHVRAQSIAPFEGELL